MVLESFLFHGEKDADVKYFVQSWSVTGVWGPLTLTVCVCFAGTLAVPDAAAQGHGDPGRGADAEGAAGHRW